MPWERFTLASREKFRAKIKQKYGKMKVITCNLPEIDLDYINMIIGAYGFVPSRSEYIRIAVRNQINKDIKNQAKKVDIINGEIELDPEKFVRVPGYNGNQPVEIIKRLD